MYWNMFQMKATDQNYIFVPCLHFMSIGDWDVKLTTHLHLVPRSSRRGAIPHSTNTSSWRGA